jgi:hypothetical protein
MYFCHCLSRKTVICAYLAPNTILQGDKNGEWIGTA